MKRIYPHFAHHTIVSQCIITLYFFSTVVKVLHVLRFFEKLCFRLNPITKKNQLQSSIFREHCFPVFNFLACLVLCLFSNESLLSPVCRRKGAAKLPLLLWPVTLLRIQRLGKEVLHPDWQPAHPAQPRRRS